MTSKTAPAAETAVDAEELLLTALDVAEHTLRCGGDVRRVEETITRICSAFGAVHIEAFTITSVIVASVCMPDGTRSQQMRRVHGNSNNLSTLETINSISRSLCEGKLTLSEAREAVKEARRKMAYPLWVYYLGAIFAAGGFAVFFGGSVLDGVAAALCGIVVTWLDKHVFPNVNQVAVTALSSFVAGLFASLLVLGGVGDNVEKVMIGAIMLLIPGVALSVSLQDLFGGELLSGALRFVHAILLALSVALGFSLSMVVAQAPVVESAVPQDWVVLLTGVIGTIGFSLVFSTKPKHLPFCALSGFLSCLLYLLALRYWHCGVFLSNMIGAAAGGLFSAVCARVRKAPRNIFIIAAMIPLVPGSGLYYTMANIVSKNVAEAFTYFTTTLQTAVCISAGFLAVTALAQVFDYLRENRFKNKNRGNNHG
ncbi:MAG: threonine/serine exporter family protein [Clostridia bacterium]|nr:threonine/serine exporter family protein [Clostridia bacterium]